MINLFEIELWLRFSLPQKTVYMTFSLVRPLLSSPSIFSLSPLDRSLLVKLLSVALSPHDCYGHGRFSRNGPALHLYVRPDDVNRRRIILTTLCAPNSTQLVFVGTSSCPLNFVSPSHYHPSSILYVMLILVRVALTGWLRRHRRLGLDHEFKPRVALHMESRLDSSQGCLPVLPVRELFSPSCLCADTSVYS